MNRKNFSWNILGIFIFCCISGCSVNNVKYFAEMNNAVDATYGYTRENPIPIKNGSLKSTQNTAEFFVSHISTAQGNSFDVMGRKYTVLKPECNSPLLVYGGSPMEIINVERECILDYYHLVSQNELDTITLYFDFSSKKKFKLPVGLRFNLEE